MAGVFRAQTCVMVIPCGSGNSNRALPSGQSKGINEEEEEDVLKRGVQKTKGLEQKSLESFFMYSVQVIQTAVLFVC